MRHRLPLLLGGTWACTGAAPVVDSGSPAAEATTIYGVHTGNVEGAVTLDDVIATTPLGRDGHTLWVQDPGGGPHSGLPVYLPRGAETLDLAVGDTLRLDATTSEAFGRTELLVDDLDDIEVTGTADPTVDVDVDPLDPAWTGALVLYEEPTIAACPDLLGAVALDEGLSLGTAFVDIFAGPDDELEVAVGVVDSALGEVQLHPRTADDLVGTLLGSSCSTTLQAIRADEVEGGVLLEQIVATSGLTREGDGFFAQDPDGASGMFISLAWLPPDHGLAPEPGDLLALRGTAMTQDQRRQVAVTSTEAVWEMGTAEVTAVSISTEPDDWSLLQGNLLTLQGLQMTGEPNTDGSFTTTWDVLIDDLLSSVNLDSGVTYTGLTGPLDRSGDSLLLCPRDEDDIVVGEDGGTVVGTYTITDIQAGLVAVNSLVQLEGAVATSSVALDGSGYTLQDPGGGANAGIWVTLSVPEGQEVLVFPDDAVSLLATFVQDDDGRVTLRQDVATDLVVSGAGGETPTELVTLPEDWSPYEAGLVGVFDMELTELHADGAETDLGLVLDFRFVEPEVEVGATFSSVIGIVFQGDDDTIRLAPRSAFDLRE